ncbi:Sodium/glucose cotransporter [Pontiella desulfatans]|uniref:Sodium/glucose cotransporter n=1 Tax=Pontiella desulfatans TaxID=2750659 RepID=A0A6C2TWX8_PONDE|nr:sodium/solute symporter [Pontiella desulfatans]VGO12024.1 Sodium/glucose cotransporter [Pontiella desulfatans]
MQTVQFGTLNYLVLAIYLAGMLGIGVFFARKQESGEMFFLGGRKLPWLAVAMSMYASLTSAVTYLGLPGTAYSENIALIIVCIMSPVVAPFILLLFYPIYHRLQVTTSYEYIEKRFGQPARYGVAGLFVLARLGWLGTVVYAPAMAMSIVTGIPLWGCICMMGILATAYTALGGLAAVVWTDVIQFVILIGGAIWVAVSLGNGVEGGTAEIFALAKEAGRLHIADWKFNLFAMSGPVVAISFFFQLMQDYGTDQVTVQRLMATGSLKKTVKSVAFNACTDFFIIGLLLFIGLGLFAFFHGTEIVNGIGSDKVMPYYIIHYLPQGISGLLITAVFAAAMSSMDSGINSIATVLINDFKITPHDSRITDVALARIITVGLGVAATSLAFYVSTIGGIIKAFASFMSLFSAPVLALFLMGVLTRKGNFQGWLVGLAVSVPATLWLQKMVEAHWVYYFPVSFLVAFGTALLASRFFNSAPAPNELTVWKK